MKIFRFLTQNVYKRVARNNYADVVVVLIGTLEVAVVGIGKEILGKSPGNPGGNGPPIKEGGMPPKGLDNIGEEAKRIRSNSDSCNLLLLALRF